jgi:hypothetical protein
MGMTDRKGRRARVTLAQKMVREVWVREGGGGRGGGKKDGEYSETVGCQVKRKQREDIPISAST